MSRKLVISLVFAFACAGADTTATPEPAPVPEPPPVASMDPIAVSPSAHSLIFENDQIRVIKASFDPGEESAMHSHPDSVGYVVSGGKLDFTGPDGTVEHRESATGTAMFRPATSHAVKNVGDTVTEIAVVELKAPTNAAAPAGTDPVVAGPTIYKQVFDDEHVRVFETTFAKGAEIPMHAHPDHAAYVLSGGKLQITGADGVSQDIDLAAGQAVYLPATTHAAKNLGDTEIKLVVYEFKPQVAVAGP